MQPILYIYYLNVKILIPWLVYRATICERRHSVGVDPVPVLRHLDIHPGDVRGASDAPGDQAHHCPSARLGLKRGIQYVMIKL